MPTIIALSWVAICGLAFRFISPIFGYLMLPLPLVFIGLICLYNPKSSRPLDSSKPE